MSIIALNCQACSPFAPCADCEKDVDQAIAETRAAPRTLAHTPLTAAGIAFAALRPSPPDIDAGIAVCRSCKEAVYANRLSAHREKKCRGFQVGRREQAAWNRRIAAAKAAAKEGRNG